MKNRVKQYVKEGRFEFINGGWSASDEACPTFNDLIDNMLLGHEFLMKEFGVVPRAAWMIDSFGHTATNARIYADIGFEAMFTARMDKEDKAVRFGNKEMQYIWRPDTEHFGNQHQILIHEFNGHYCFPDGFAVDEYSGDGDPF